MRLSGYRLALERSGMRSKVAVVDPGSGAIALTVPERYPGRLFGGGGTAGRLLERLQALPPAGPPPDTQNPELLHQVLLAFALRDESVSEAEAVELADRALEAVRRDPSLAPPAALEAARRGG